MPASYRIDTLLGCVFANFYGIVTEADLEEYFRALLADPNFNTSYKHLIDTRKTTETQMRIEYINSLARRGGSLPPDIMQAFVASSDLSYGLLRMYIAQHPESNKMEVFRDYEEACRWLGLPDTDSQTS